MKTNKKYYLSTPLYYVNGKPHLGHLFSTLYCDFFKRFQEYFTKNEVLLITGCDQHGKKISQAAKNNKKSEIIFVKENTTHFQKLWNLFAIKYTHFIETSSPKHILFVQNIFHKLLKDKHIEIGKYKGWYCLRCENFINNSKNILFKEDLAFCQICQGELNFIEEENYFLIVSNQEKEWLLNQLNNWEKKFDDHFIYHKVKKVINSKIDNLETNFVYQKNINHHKKYLKQVFAQIKIWIKESDNLNFAITRKNINWGIPILDVEIPNQTVYVWFDALLGYLSKLNENELNIFWKNKVKNHFVYQIIGKEISKFHLVYWPLLLKKIGFEVPDLIFVHQWILNGDLKMSKSLGNVLDPKKIIEDIPFDTNSSLKYRTNLLRFFLPTLMKSHQDNHYFENQFINQFYPNFLVHRLGNFCNRILNLIKIYQPNLELKNIEKLYHLYQKDPLWIRYFNNPLNSDPINLESLFHKELKAYFYNMERFAFDLAVESIWNLITEFDILITKLELWNLAKEDLNKFTFWIYTLLNILNSVSHLIIPFAPEISDKIFTNLNQKILNQNLELYKDEKIIWNNWNLKFKNNFSVDKMVKLFTYKIKK